MTRPFRANELKMFSLAEKVLFNRNAEPSLLAAFKNSQMTQGERQALIDLVAAELCEKGFDADSEPTAYGQELERLVDYLNGQNLV